MSNNKQQTAVDSIIEFCHKEMDNDYSIHKGVYLSIIKFCQELPSDESLKDKLFNLADEFAFAGNGKTAVILHTIHNGLGNNEQKGGNNEQQ